MAQGVREGLVPRQKGAGVGISFAALRMTAETGNGKSKGKEKTKIQGSLHCAMDVKLSIASVEMTLFFGLGFGEKGRKAVELRSIPHPAAR